MMPNRWVFKKQTYWSFYDILSNNGENDAEPYVDINFDYSTISDVFGSSYANKLCSSGTTLKAHITDLLNMVYSRFYDHYVYGTDGDETSDLYGRKFINFKNKILSIIEQTYERYSTLLNLYASEKSKLLDGVKTTTTGVGRFNDTPQNITNGDEFGDNTHISNITKSTAEAVSDVDTKMARLDEITKRYRNLLKEWTNEFDGLFIEERNI